MHLLHYALPGQQRHVVRVMFFVPVFAGEYLGRYYSVAHNAAEMQLVVAGSVQLSVEVALLHRKISQDILSLNSWRRC